MTKIHLTLASLLALGVLAFAATPALAAEVHVYMTSFGSEGSGPGQLREPVGVAVNDETGDVYVVDKGNDRVEYFNAAGTYKGEFNGSGLLLNEGMKEAGSGGLANEILTGRFEKPEWIAVDNDKSSPSFGDVYVTDNGHKVIDKFSPTGEYLGQVTGGAGGAAFSELEGVAVDAAGTVWVAQHNPNDAVDAYSDAADNAFIASRTLPTVCEGPCTPGPGFAVGPEDDLYVNIAAGGGHGQYVRYTSSGQEVGEPVGPRGLEIAPAVNLSSNGLYLDVGPKESSASRVDAFNGVPGSLVESFGAANLTGASGIAVNSAPTGTLANAVYVVEQRGRVELFDYIVIPDVTSAPAVNVTVEPEHGTAGATLNGTVNPNGHPVTSCVFEYGATTAYGASQPCAVDPGAGTTPVPVSVELHGLSPDVTYHFRLRAADSSDEADAEVQLEHAGADQTFTTPGAGVRETAAREVTADSAVVAADVDPDGNPTTWHVEYDTREYREGEPAHGTSAPAPEGSLGSGHSAMPVSETLQGLAPSTQYWYRVVAVSELEVGGVMTAVTFDGPDHTFTTQRAGTEFTLPDGRQYELVSPPQKQGALFMGDPLVEKLMGARGCHEGEHCRIQAATSGDALADEAQQPSERGAAGDANSAMVLMTRSAGGWSSRVISTPHLKATGAALGAPGPEYGLFSEDLSHAVLGQWGDFDPLSPEAVEQTPYLRTNYLGGDLAERCEAPDLSASSCYQPLVTRANTAPGTVFGDEYNGECPYIDCGPQVVAGTRDLSHVIVAAREPLTAEPVVVGRGESQSLAEPALYEWSQGRLRLLDVLPGRTAGGEMEISWRRGDAEHVVSADGDRVILEGVNAQIPSGHFYVRDVAKGETVELPGIYATANDEDTRIFTVDNGALDECALTEVAGQDACKTTDLTPEADGEPPNVESVLGASEDGSYVYFAAGGKLAPGASAKDVCAPNGIETGPCNLYVYHDGATRFVAELSFTDLDLYLGSSTEQGGYVRLRARVSPDGRWLAFMSNQDLTGYDNTDLSEEETLEAGALVATKVHHDQEVYLYHAPAALASEAGTLSCASCDPTGARPVGLDNDASGGGRAWAAASLPSDSERVQQRAFEYQPRYLSDSGRLFFDSKDALVPLDVNGTIDVYEYEPQGVPSGEHGCSPHSASASAAFKPARTFEAEGVAGEEAAGCVALISSGTSAQPSAFLDASETGGDVFFITASKLSSQDLEGGLSIYDAQECTSAAPCPPPPALTPPPCGNAESCRSAPQPQPEAFGAPSSATFTGPGNLTPPPPAVVPKKVTKRTVTCKKGFVKKKVKKKQVCVKKPKKSSKAKKSAHTNRRTHS